MLDRYGPFYEYRPPLLHDTEIYWADKAWCAEVWQSIEIVRDAIVADWLTRALDRETHSALAGSGCYRAYHQEDRETIEDGVIRIRRTIYECPFFREIKRYSAPHIMRDFRIAPQGQEIVTLPLRRLMYRGERLHGALHDDILYVIDWPRE